MEWWNFKDTAFLSFFFIMLILLALVVFIIVSFSISLSNRNKDFRKVKDDSIKDLIKHTRLILNRAIKAGGTTIRSYTSSLGVTGRFQLKLKVHTLDKCPYCGSKIKKIRVGGRGTYYCPKCQKG